ncbi:hypothetical protein [Mesorhizobium sp. L-8-3]|uniref:hypothetical protein n=1 Tax=Mesorhizobium sp. L-8-3 TaxID=2744522 RepID=UPI00192600D5|nr:hypothetical protein [Mesorhizobium sp. L-8-3]BCH26203.1 hypothetical protein MesoLjLb_59880 [Mesorhizobium sp. L-8-3]
MARLSSILLLLVCLAASGTAQASSLIVLEASNDPVGPSMMVVGGLEPASPEAAGPSDSVSVVAVGEAPPAVSGEKLSSITSDAPQSGPRAVPMVIRGGIVGDAFTRSLPTPAPAAQPPAATRAPATSRPEPEAPLVGPSAESELDLR